MKTYGIRTSPSKNVKNSVIKDLGATSETNQYKLQGITQRTFTSNNQRLNIRHGLIYTPAFLVFKKMTAETFYRWGDNGSDYVDTDNVSILGTSTNDQATVIIFKDFGQ